MTLKELREAEKTQREAEQAAWQAYQAAFEATHAPWEAYKVAQAEAKRLHDVWTAAKNALKAVREENSHAA